MISPPHSRAREVEQQWMRARHRERLLRCELAGKQADNVEGRAVAAEDHEGSGECDADGGVRVSRSGPSTILNERSRRASTYRSQSFGDNTAPIRVSVELGGLVEEHASKHDWP